jgi:hypothetical protein
MSPFDFINAICESKDKSLIEQPDGLKNYRKSAFIVNRGLAYHYDTVLQANEMNRLNWIPPDWQFSYLLNNITKKKRFSKWQKTEKNQDLDFVMQYYAYNKQKAMVALSILNEEQLSRIRKSFDKGGKP